MIVLGSILAPMKNSNSITIDQAKEEKDLQLIEQLAAVIWEEHYTPIIGADQVRYMLDRFQSTAAMQMQVTEGYEYFILRETKEPVGYLAYEKRGPDLFLSKIYVLREHRGKKIGKRAMDFVESRARAMGCSRISLTVNKNNDKSLLAYKSMGFLQEGAAVMEIGNGFVMDDYLLYKPLNSKG